MGLQCSCKHFGSPDNRERCKAPVCRSELSALLSVSPGTSYCNGNGCPQSWTPTEQASRKTNVSSCVASVVRSLELEVSTSSFVGWEKSWSFYTVQRVGMQVNENQGRVVGKHLVRKLFESWTPRQNVQETVYYGGCPDWLGGRTDWGGDAVKWDGQSVQPWNSHPDLGRGGCHQVWVYLVSWSSEDLLVL